MTEPTVSYPLRVVLDEIKGEIRALKTDVSELKTGSALQVAEEAHQAARQAARRALWSAVASPVVAGGVAWLATRR